MKLHAKIAVAVILLGGLAAAAYHYLSPGFEAQRQIQTSDARGTKGRIEIGMDNWIGYFPLCSLEMRKRMRTAGYVLHCEDDQADTAQRFEGLRSGRLQFAVTTVDAYLSGGRAAGFPGALVAVIDESQGGDAIVAHTDTLPSLDALKALPSARIAFTPSSPSEYLLQAASVHFDLPQLRDPRGAWRVETDGSPEALRQLLDGQVDAAVLWEPDVTRALADPGIGKLLSTADAEQLIVDVLIAGREVVQQDPDMVRTLLANYFAVLRHYLDHPEALARDVMAETKLPQDQVGPMLAGVGWIDLLDNAQVWFGATAKSSAIVDVIASTSGVLIDSGALKRDPLPDGDPYRILNRSFLQTVFTAAAAGPTNADLLSPAALAQAFTPLSDSDWNALREVGTLKAKNVGFQSGTAELSYDGKLEVDRMVEVLRHYPTFRLRVLGHTGLNGDPAINQTLSKDRAEAVARYMNVTYNIDPNRMQIVGLGSSKPLARLPAETDRAYQYRLPRVEVVLLAERM